MQICSEISFQRSLGAYILYFIIYNQIREIIIVYVIIVCVIFWFNSIQTMFSKDKRFFNDPIVKIEDSGFTECITSIIN